MADEFTPEQRAEAAENLGAVVRKGGRFEVMAGKFLNNVRRTIAIGIGTAIGIAGGVAFTAASSTQETPKLSERMARADIFSGNIPDDPQLQINAQEQAGLEFQAAIDNDPRTRGKILIVDSSRFNDTERFAQEVERATAALPPVNPASAKQAVAWLRNRMNEAKSGNLLEDTRSANAPSTAASSIRSSDPFAGGFHSYKDISQAVLRKAVAGAYPTAGTSIADATYFCLALTDPYKSESPFSGADYIPGHEAFHGIGGVAPERSDKTPQMYDTRKEMIADAGIWLWRIQRGEKKWRENHEGSLEDGLKKDIAAIYKNKSYDFQHFTAPALDLVLADLINPPQDGTLNLREKLKGMPISEIGDLARDDYAHRGAKNFWRDMTPEQSKESDKKMQAAIDFRDGKNTDLSASDIDARSAAFLIRIGDLDPKFSGLLSPLIERMPDRFHEGRQRLSQEGYQPPPPPPPSPSDLTTQIKVADLAGIFGPRNEDGTFKDEAMRRVNAFADLAGGMQGIGNDGPLPSPPANLDARGMFYLLAYDASQGGMGAEGAEHGSFLNTGLAFTLNDLQQADKPAFRQAKHMAYALNFASDRLEGTKTELAAKDVNPQTAQMLEKLSQAAAENYGEDNGLTKAMPELREKFPTQFRAAEALTAKENAAANPLVKASVTLAPSGRRLNPHI